MKQTNKLLIIAAVIGLTFISLDAWCQTHRYFKAVAYYNTSDGCSHSDNIWFEATNGTNNFDNFNTALVKYVKPYKIIKRTLRVDDYHQISHKEYLSLKPKKFEPCKPLKFTALSSGNLFTYCDTCKVTFSGTSSLVAKSNFIWMGSNKIIISISQPDSNKIVTVHLSKNDITFLNDSTFTFKQPN